MGAERARKKRTRTIWKEFIARVKNPFIRIFDGKVSFRHEGSHNRTIGEVFCVEGGPRHNNTGFIQKLGRNPRRLLNLSARFWVHIRDRVFYKNVQETPETEGEVCRSRAASSIALRRRQCGEMVDVHIKSAIGGKIDRAVISPAPSAAASHLLPQNHNTTYTV